MTFLELAIVLLNLSLACFGGIWLVSKSLKALSAKRVGKDASATLSNQHGKLTAAADRHL